MIKVLKALVLSVFVSGALLMLLALAVVPAIPADETEAAQVLAQTQESGRYWLRAYNGHIAVFFDDEDTPAIETTIETGSLREIDRKQLETGIEAVTYEEVLKLLEDFGS